MSRIVVQSLRETEQNKGTETFIKIQFYLLGTEIRLCIYEMFIDHGDC